MLHREDCHLSEHQSHKVVNGAAFVVFILFAVLDDILFETINTLLGEIAEQNM